MCGLFRLRLWEWLRRRGLPGWLRKDGQTERTIAPGCHPRAKSELWCGDSRFPLAKKMIRFSSHGSSQRQPQEKGAAVAPTAGAEAAAVCAGDGLGDRQSESRSAGMARSIAINSVKAIEYAR